LPYLQILVKPEKNFPVTNGLAYLSTGVIEEEEGGYVWLVPILGSAVPGTKKAF
jgi:hypothetical protein